MRERIALTFDDGPSFYRPRRSRPSAPRACPRRSSTSPCAWRPTRTSSASRSPRATVLLHSYEHPRLTNLSPNGLRFQVEGAAALFAALGAPLSHKVLRAPFGGTNAAINAAVAAMGFAMTAGLRGHADFDPVRTAAQIRDAMLAALRPGRGSCSTTGRSTRPPGQAVGRRGPADHRRGAGSRLLLRHGRRGRARRRRPLHRHGAADPADRHPVPYIPPAYPGTPPSPYALVPQPLRIAASARPGRLPARRDRHAHADRLQPDDRPPDRRQPDRGHAPDPRRADRDERVRRRAGRARARRPSPARATRSSRRARRCRRSRSACRRRRPRPR